jgi:hypothetical protein
MRKLPVIFIMIPMIMTLVCSCISLDADKQRTGQDNIVLEEEKTAAGNRDTQDLNEDPVPEDEETPGPPNNIMFQNSQAGFAFVYPHDGLALYSCQCRDPEYGGFSLDVDISKLESMQGTMLENALEEMDALANGEFGPDNDFSYLPSRNVIELGGVYVKEYMVLSRYDVCDVTFERIAVFYNKGYQVRIALAADSEQIIGEAEEYFTTDEINCLEEKIWAEGGREAFYDAVASGNAGQTANKWYGAFKDIMHLLQINEFKGASAGYSRVDDNRYFEENDEDRYIIDIAYPQFQSAHAGGLDDSINRSIYDELIGPMIDDFRSEVASYDYEDENINYFLAVDYEVISFDEDIISLCININPYMGGAHGMQYFETINYSIGENRLLELADLFEPGYDHMGAISEYCRMDLIRQMQERGFMPDEEWIEDGTDPSYTDTFTSWLLSSRGLMIKFPAYQAGPYAAGDFIVVIPYDKLDSLVLMPGAG